MNPFEDIDNSTNTTTSLKPIYIWVEKMGRKHNTYVSGWNIADNEIKEHLKNFKKKNGCNGSIKEMLIEGNSLERVMQLQGYHADCVNQFIIDTGIDANLIHIKG